MHDANSKMRQTTAWLAKVSHDCLICFGGTFVLVWLAHCFVRRFNYIYKEKNYEINNINTLIFSWYRCADWHARVDRHFVCVTGDGGGLGACVCHRGVCSSSGVHWFHGCRVNYFLLFLILFVCFRNINLFEL